MKKYGMMMVALGFMFSASAQAIPYEEIWDRYSASLKVPPQEKEYYWRALQTFGERQDTQRLQASLQDLGLPPEAILLQTIKTVMPTVIAERNNYNVVEGLDPFTQWLGQQVRRIPIAQ